MSTRGRVPLSAGSPPPVSRATAGQQGRRGAFSATLERVRSLEMRKNWACAATRARLACSIGRAGVLRLAMIAEAAGAHAKNAPPADFPGGKRVRSRVVGAPHVA